MKTKALAEIDAALLRRRNQPKILEVTRSVSANLGETDEPEIHPLAGGGELTLYRARGKVRAQVHTLLAKGDVALRWEHEGAHAVDLKRQGPIWEAEVDESVFMARLIHVYIDGISNLIDDMLDPALAAEAHAEALKVYKWCINGSHGVGTVDDLTTFVHPSAAACWVRDVGWRELPGIFDEIGTLFTHPSDDFEGCKFGEATIHLGGRPGYPALRLRFKIAPQPRWEIAAE